MGQFFRAFWQSLKEAGILLGAFLALLILTPTVGAVVTIVGACAAAVLSVLLGIKTLTGWPRWDVKSKLKDSMMLIMYLPSLLTALFSFSYFRAKSFFSSIAQGVQATTGGKSTTRQLPPTTTSREKVTLAALTQFRKKANAHSQDMPVVPFAGRDMTKTFDDINAVKQYLESEGCRQAVASTITYGRILKIIVTPQDESALNEHTLSDLQQYLKDNAIPCWIELNSRVQEPPDNSPLEIKETPDNSPLEVKEPPDHSPLDDAILKNNQVFADIFLSNRRKYLSQALQSAGLTEAHPLTSGSHAGSFTNVSRAKLNLAEGVVSAIGLQREQQQMVQQQQATETSLEQSRETQLRACVKPGLDKEPEVASLEELGEIVDRFGYSYCYSSRFNSKPSVADRLKRLVKDYHFNKDSFWSQLVGQNEAKIAKSHPGHAITDIQYEALCVLAKHFTLFSDGLVLDNLPRGFFLKKTEKVEAPEGRRYGGQEAKLVLCYSEELASSPVHEESDRSPLKITLNNPFWLPNASIETLSYDLAPAVYQHTRAVYERLSSSPPPEDQRLIIVTLIKAYHPSWTAQEEKALDEKLSDLHLRQDQLEAVTHSILQSGGDAALLFLDTLHEIKQAGCYEHFKENFLSNTVLVNNYSAYMTKDSILHLRDMKTWSGNERIWWESLVEQHLAHEPCTDFNELYLAFNYFISEIKKMNCHLPVLVPSDIKNMKVALDRLLIVLRASANKKEQCQEAAWLDLGIEGAVHASVEGFKLVTQEMQCSVLPRTQKIDKDIVAYPIPDTDPTIHVLFNKNAGRRGLLKAMKDHPAVTLNMIGNFLKEIKDSITDTFVQNNLYPLVAHDKSEKDFLRRNDADDVIGLERPKNLFSFKLPLLLKAQKKKQELIDALYDDAAYEALDQPSREACDTINKMRLRTVTPPQQPIPNPSPTLQELDYADHLHDQAFLTELISNPPPDRQNSETNKAYFFRFIGLQPMALPIAFYRYIAQTLNQPSPLNHTLLHFLGTVTTNRRQLRNGQDTERVNQLIHEMQHVNFEVIIDWCHQLRKMRGDNQPSLKDIIMIVKLLQEDTHLEKVLAYIEKYGPSAYLVLENSLKRRENTKLTPCHWENLFEKIKDMPPELGEILSITDNVNSVTAENITALNNALQEKLCREGDHRLYEAYLNAVRMVQVDGSRGLPTYQSILASIDEIAQKYPADTLLEIANLNQSVAETLQQAWPTTHILEKSPVKKFALGVKQLSNIIADVNEEYVVNGISRIINEMGEDTKKFNIKPFRDLVEQVRGAVLEIKMTPDTEDGLLASLNILDDLEQQASATFQSIPWTMMPLLTAYLASLSADDPIKQFFNTKYILSPFFKMPIKERMCNQFGDQLSHLRMGEGRIRQYFMDVLDTVDIDKPIATALKNYIEKVNLLQSDLNVFIEAYQNLSLSDFNTLTQSVEQHFATLTFKQHIGLIRNCQKGDKAHCHEEIALCYDILSNPEVAGYSEQHFERAMEGLSDLMPYAAHLKTANKEAFNRILMHTFKHNLTKDTPFPVKALFDLKTQASIDAEKLELLCDLFLKRIGADADEGVLHKIEEALTKTTELLKNKPQCAELLTTLLQFDEGTTVASWEAYLDCLKVIEKLNTSNLALLPTLSHIFSSLLSTQSKAEHPASLATLINQCGALDHSTLSQLNVLFNFDPFPNATQLERAINNPATLKDWIEHFDLDPFNLRNAGELKKQFDLSQMKRVVREMKRLPDETPLPIEEQIKFVKQMTYINALGQDRFDDKPLTAYARQALSALAQQLVSAIREAATPAAKEHAQLKLLACAREIHFRATGKFPNSTQMLTALLSLHYPGNLFLQLMTGEGKSVLSPFFLLLEWVKGGAVNACTANDDLASRDYHEKKAFYQFFNIQSKYIDHNSARFSYATQGINYSTVAGSSLYRSAAKLEGEKMRAVVDGQKAPTASLVLDECDYATLDDRTTYNLASGGAVNSYAWIYPLINAFVNKKEYQNVSPYVGPVWDTQQDVSQLREYLRKETESDPLHADQLQHLTDEQYKKWLHAATLALQLREGMEFVIQRQGNEDVAVPLDKNIPQVGSTLEGGVQQFLHARLQTEKAEKEPGVAYHFPIYDEFIKVASEKTKNFLNHYLRKGGRLIGISGTPGSLATELPEQIATYGIHAFSIPTHAPSQYQALPMQATKVGENHIRAIAKTIKKLKKGDDLQPILIVCKNMEDAKALHEALGKRLHASNVRLQPILGTETIAERAKWIEQEAGKPNTITISTSLLGRGTDIKTTHKRGLGVIQTYLDNSRTSRQILGRTARNGQVGYGCVLIEKEGVIAQHDIDLSGYRESDRLRKLNEVYKKIDEEAAIERHYLQEMDAVQNILLDHFRRWHKLILRVVENHPNAVQKENIKRDLLKKREMIIEHMKEAWRDLLELSDPEKLYPNVYVRRKTDGSLETETLDDCVSVLEEYALKEWENIQQELYGQYNLEMQGIADGRGNAYRAYYDKISKIDLKTALDARHQQHANDDTAPSLSSLDAEAELSLAAIPEIARSTYENINEEQAKRALQAAWQVFTERAVKILSSAKMKNKDRGQLTELLKKNTENWTTQQLIQHATDWLTQYRAQATHWSDPFKVEWFAKILAEFSKKHGAQDQHDQMKDPYLVIRDRLKNALDSLANSRLFYGVETKSVKEATHAILACLSEESNDEHHLAQVKKLYKTLFAQEKRLQGQRSVGLFHEDIKKTIRDAVSVLDEIAHSKPAWQAERKAAQDELLKEATAHDPSKVKMPKRTGFALFGGTKKVRVDETQAANSSKNNKKQH
jgi:preprotein translocase subunit SecA